MKVEIDWLLFNFKLCWLLVIAVLQILPHACPVHSGNTEQRPCVGFGLLAEHKQGQKFIDFFARHKKADSLRYASFSP